MRPSAPLLTVVGLLGMALVVGGVPEVRSGLGHAIAGDTQAMRGDIGGATGALVIFALAMAHVVVWYPSEILDAAAGLLYGFWLGFVIVHLSWIVSGLAAYAVGRHLGRPALHRMLGGERLDRAESFVDRGGWQALLAARLIPIVPFSLFSYVAGAARVPLGRYTWTTAIGYVPITALAVLFGTRAEELSLTDPVMLASLGGLLVLLGLSAVVGRRLPSVNPPGTARPPAGAAPRRPRGPRRRREESPRRSA